MSLTTDAAVDSIWRAAGLDPAALRRLQLPGSEPGFTLDGVAPELWDKIAGLYRCAPAARNEWVRVHTNFAHHRNGLLHLLGLPGGPDTSPEQVSAAILGWRADNLEDEAAARGLVVARLRSFEEWDRHPPGDRRCRAAADRDRAHRRRAVARFAEACR